MRAEIAKSVSLSKADIGDALGNVRPGPQAVIMLDVTVGSRDSAKDCSEKQGDLDHYETDED